MAQAALESDWGQSTLATKYFNLFGIKGSDPRNTQVLTTKEFVNDQWIETSGRFRVFTDWNQAIQVHSQLMVNGTSNNPHLYDRVIQAANYQDAAIALQNAGYATDPTYAQKLIKLIQQYHLDRYDQWLTL